MEYYTGPPPEDDSWTGLLFTVTDHWLHLLRVGLDTLFRRKGTLGDPVLSEDVRLFLRWRLPWV